MTLKKTLVLAAMAVATAAGMTNAATRTAVQSGPWSDSATWGGAVPSFGDTAVINDAYTVTVDEDTTVALVQVVNGGVLQVELEKVLTIGAGYFNSEFVTHQIDGYLVLEDGLLEIDSGHIDVDNGGAFVMQGDTPRVQVDAPDGMRLPSAASSMWILADAAFGGSGSIYAADSDALIIINIATNDDVELTLESGFTLRGAMTFLSAPDTSGKGRLNNQGQIKADAGSGTRILLDSSLYAITDGGGSCTAPNWKTTANSTLRFEKGSTSLTSAFDNLGTISVANPLVVTTTGKMPNVGTFDLPFSAQFNYNHTACP